MSAGIQRWDGEEELVAAATAGDQSAFATISERHRSELQAHCYRMVGSLHDSEDLVQETFLRAWRARETFSYQGPSSYRAWLYRVATNSCLDLLRRKPRTPFPWQPGGAGQNARGALLRPADELAWLQPYPDQLLGAVAPSADQPEARLVARDAIELAFIATVQLLPPTQRAVLILRDVLEWSAKEAAALLETTVVAVNSALQRARATLRHRLSDPQADWTPSSTPTDRDRELVRRYMAAHERRDFAALAALLRSDARLTMPPTPSWFEGRQAIAALFASWLDPGSPEYVGEVRHLPIAANRQLGSAGYLRRPGDSEFRPLGLQVLRIANSEIAEVTMFVSPDLFASFALPDRI